jgi:hypothetical protein
MQRNAVQTAVSETIRKALPSGFSLRGGVRISYYKAVVFATAPMKVALDTRVPIELIYVKAEAVVARIQLHDSVIKLVLAKNRKPRGMKGPLIRNLTIHLEEPDSLGRLEQWARNLNLVNLPWTEKS